MPAGHAGPPDPQKGVPYRHVKAKFELLIKDIEDDPLALAALARKFADLRPEEALDAIIWLTEDDGKAARP